MKVAPRDMQLVAFIERALIFVQYNAVLITTIFVFQTSMLTFTNIVGVTVTPLIVAISYNYIYLFRYQTVVILQPTSVQYFSMMSQYFLMNFSLSALSARIYPIVDFEVVGTLIYNGLSGFALKRL